MGQLKIRCNSKTPLKAENKPVSKPARERDFWIAKAVLGSQTISRKECHIRQTTFYPPTDKGSWGEHKVHAHACNFYLSKDSFSVTVADNFYIDLVHAFHYLSFQYTDDYLYHLYQTLFKV
jgi:hypothetical protein